MTLQMFEKETYNFGFNAGKNFGFAAGEEHGRKQGRNEGISLGISRGEHKKAIETAKNLILLGLSQEQIASATGLSVEEIEKL